jgi:IPT/TIG domain
LTATTREVVVRKVAAAVVAIGAMVPVVVSSPMAAIATTGPTLSSVAQVAFNPSWNNGAAYDAFLPDGHLLVDESGEGTIYEMNADGSDESIFATGLSNPQGIAVSSAGSVFVAVTGGVVRFDADGTLTITGTNLVSATSVGFGAASIPAASFVSDTATKLRVTIPAGSGTATISVTTPGGASTSNPQYTYDQPPTISSVAPSTGTVKGGTVVVISGTNLTHGLVGLLRRAHGDDQAEHRHHPQSDLSGPQEQEDPRGSDGLDHHARWHRHQEQRVHLLQVASQPAGQAHEGVGG